jgi:membrane protease YdiL (CAAX protease family)
MRLPRRLGQPLRWRWRLAVAIAAVVAGAAHVPVIREHLDEAPYMGVLFLLLTIACGVLAAALVTHDSAGVYVAAVALCGTAIAGYTATRIVAFPQLADDVGDWLEPLGVLAVASEVAVVVTALAALRAARHRDQWVL